VLLDVASEASEASGEAEVGLVKYCHILGCRFSAGFLFENQTSSLQRPQVFRQLEPM